MATSALREIVLGVADLAARTRFYEEIVGLTVVARGMLEPVIGGALWGLSEAVEVVTLARPDVPGSPRIRLVEADGPPARADANLLHPGPVGLGFTTRGVQAVWNRFAAAGVRFLSPPLSFTPEASQESGPVRYEAFGQAADSEYVVLIERLNVPTPYGVISDEHAISEPLHCSHSVSDLEACSRFMQDVLGHERIFREECEGELFERLMGLPAGTRLSFEMLHHPAFPTGRSIFIEFEDQKGTTPAIEPPRRGVSALRYDCDDLDGLIPRIEAAGGAVVRGPVGVRSKLLGQGRVAAVRPPFGVLLEIWEPEEGV